MKRLLIACLLLTGCAGYYYDPHAPGPRTSRPASKTCYLTSSRPEGAYIHCDYRCPGTSITVTQPHYKLCAHTAAPPS